MKWVILPKKQIGPINPRMQITDVEKMFSTQGDTFRRTSDSKNTEYAFDSQGIQISVNSSGAICQVLVFLPNEVFLAGVQLLGRPLVGVVHELAAAGFSFKNVDAGAWSKSEAIMLVEVDGLVDGVEVTFFD